MRYKDTIGLSSILSHLQFEMTRRIEEKLRDLELTLPQYSALSILEDSTNLTNADISRKCHVTPQTMNRILNNLESVNLVTKQSDPQHGLKFIYSLTGKAEKLICKAHEKVNEIESQAIEGINKKDYSNFSSLLELMTLNITAKK